jgi:hypothetical protein
VLSETENTFFAFLYTVNHIEKVLKVNYVYIYYLGVTGKVQIIFYPSTSKMPPTLSNVQCKHNSQLLVYKYKIQILTLSIVMANAATLITNGFSLAGMLECLYMSKFSTIDMNTEYHAKRNLSTLKLSLAQSTCF